MDIDLSEAALEPYAQGLSDGKNFERKKIVNWLRKEANHDCPFGLDPDSALGLPLDCAAACIERGEHYG